MGDASFRPLSALHPEPATGFRPQDDLSCFFQPTNTALDPPKMPRSRRTRDFDFPILEQIVGLNTEISQFHHSLRPFLCALRNCGLPEASETFCVGTRISPLRVRANTLVARSCWHLLFALVRSGMPEIIFCSAKRRVAVEKGGRKAFRIPMAGLGSQAHPLERHFAIKKENWSNYKLAISQSQ